MSCDKYVCELGQILSEETLQICCEKRIDATLILWEKKLFSAVISTPVSLVRVCSPPIRSNGLSGCHHGCLLRFRCWMLDFKSGFFISVCPELFYLLIFLKKALWCEPSLRLNQLMLLSVAMETD